MAKALPVYAVNPLGSLAENAPLILHTRLEEMYRFAPFITDPERVDELHNMRIAAKRLRYTMEIFAPCFSGKEFNTLYNQVKSVQEQIGDIHDADVRGPLLDAFVAARAGDRPEIRVGLERLSRDQKTARDAGYRKFLTYWDKLQREGFRKRFLQMLVMTEGPEPIQEAEDEQ